MKHQSFSKAALKEHKFPKGERGAYLVEFAIVAPVFFLLMFGVMEFGRAVWSYSSVAHAAREGVRYAIVRGEDSQRVPTQSEMETFVRDKAGLSTAEVITTWTSPKAEPGSVVQVQVNYSFQPSVPMFPTMALTSTSRMMISF